MKQVVTNYPAKQRYWGTIASDYNRWRLSSPLRRYMWKREFHTLGNIVLEQIRPNSTILDAPTGTGRFVPLLRDLGHQVTGIDISLDMLKMQPLQPGQVRGSLVRGDCEALPFGDGVFDYVVSLRFLGHVPPELRSSVLLEFKRVASKGMIVGFPVVHSFTKLKFEMGNLRYRLVKGEQRCWWPATPRSLPRELEGAGLKIAHATNLLGPFSQIVFLHLIPGDSSKSPVKSMGGQVHLASV